MNCAILFAAALLTFATPAISEGRANIGEGRLFNNDYLGDGKDRWHTGFYTYSNIRAREAYSGTEAFGDLIEYRFRAAVIAPSRRSAAPGDRPYAGTLSLGVHTHFDYGGTQVNIGGDLVAIGPKTGLSDFQLAVHDIYDLPNPPYVAQQLGDQVFLNGAVAASRRYALSDTVTVRPFVEAMAGTEALVRVGGDVMIGAVGQDDLLLRDVVTGQLYRATEKADVSGISYLLVSPDHRMVLRGPHARALFNCDEVLVAARDLVNDHSILRDHSLPDVTYIHMMLPQHEIVFANGVPTESFHPACADLSAMDEIEEGRIYDRLPELRGDLANYGDYARRVLSQSEAAILNSV